MRKALNLTQQEFANRIGSVQNTITGYETGRRIPSSQVLTLICREFNVNEQWLRTGEGGDAAMFAPKPSDTLDKFIRERGLSHSDRVLIEKFAALDAKSRQVVVEYVLSAADEIMKPGASIQEQTPPDLATEVAELKRQNQELAAKIAAMEEEDALMEAASELSVSPTEYAGASERKKVKK